MPNQSDNQLIDYLDNHLSEQDRLEVEQLIHTNQDAYEQWRYLQLSVEAVEYTALYNQVGAVKAQYQKRPAIVRRMRFVLTAAAAFIIVLGLAAYKYTSTTAIALYENNYAPYNLNTSRSIDAGNGIDDAYRSKNWPAVIAAFNNTAEKDTRGLFLTAMSQMELKQYADAAKNFEQVQANNALTGSDDFQDEAEFYQAMSYLALNRGQEAVTILEKIRNDQTHLYYERANRISGLNLKIVASKSGR